MQFQYNAARPEYIWNSCFADTNSHLEYLHFEHKAKYDENISSRSPRH